MSESRRTIFISHATPADNEISRWLALRLMREGFTVWCDLDRIRVGDEFWADIKREIEDNSCKFILVATRTSVTRPGVLRELTLAAAVAPARGKRFILPVRADDLPYGEFPAGTAGLDAADFSKDWSFGFGRLLKILGEDSVPCGPGGPAKVAQWWEQRYSAAEGVAGDREEYISNRFRVTSAPRFIYLHRLDDLKPFDKARFKPNYPVHQVGGLFVSFAPAPDLAKAFHEADAAIGGTFTTKLGTFLEIGYPKPVIDVRTAVNTVTRLLRLAFEFRLRAAGLVPYEIASGENYFWFPATVSPPRKQVSFTRPNKTTGARALVGAKNLKDKTGAIIGQQLWHFGLEVLPSVKPFFGFHLRSHVAFTLNALPYADVKKQHRLRRKECKSWFNDKWSDILLAALSQLSGGAASLLLPVAAKEAISVAMVSERFVSPVHFVWPPDKEMPAFQTEDEETTEFVLDDADEDENDEEDLDE